jgi:formate hydrogenlyase subunit 3/multisubunit Na+/H+ antiporter MnhD subunit
MSTNDIFNVVGTVGSLLVLFGFYRTSVGRWTNKSPLYELDNVVGSILIIVYQVRLHAYISVIVNVIWAAVAFIGISSFTERYLRFHRGKKRTSS